MKVLHVVGKRPNFMKAAPVYRALVRSGHQQVLVHTGQHYDALMSDVFLLNSGRKHQFRPPLWDGKALERIAEVLTRQAF